MWKMPYVRGNVQGKLFKMDCERCNVKMGLLVRPAGRTSWTDQLDGPAGRTSWTGQFFSSEALASSHIRRFSFQFVHCWSFWVRRRPCFSRSTFLFKEVLDSSSLNKRTYLDKVGGSSKNFRVDPFPAGFKLAKGLFRLNTKSTIQWRPL